MSTLRIGGEVRVPGDKSITHRALMLAAAASGESRLRGLLGGADCRSTAAVLRALGLPMPDIPLDGAEIRVAGQGLDAWRTPSTPLDCGNSGTTARLMMGLVAGRPIRAVFTGDESLSSRPMRRVTEPLAAMGAGIEELGAPDRLPLAIRGGRLHGIDHLSPRASAQVKSAVLLAGVSGHVPVTVREPTHSRDHTERMLAALGVAVQAGPDDDRWVVSVDPPAGALPPLDVTVPGDPSSAAFLVALALMADEGELRIGGVGLNPTRTGFLDAVRRMGGDLEIENIRDEAGEPVGDILLKPSSLAGVAVDGDSIPAMIDEIPILAVLGARASGETVVHGAEELRAKESDRITVMVDNLRAVGVEAEELPDGLVVRGSDRPLAGAVRVHHDHRIAMAFAVLAALPGNRIEIDDPRVVDVSYPGFFDVLRTLTDTSSR